MLRSMICLFAVSMLATPAAAQDVERYQLQRTEDGYVRLDTQTGRMTLCQERGEQLVCKSAAEERDAYDQELDRLHAELEALRERVDALEARPNQELPSEEEFEQTMGYMEKFFRRFMGIVQDLEKDFGDTTEEPAPNRT